MFTRSSHSNRASLTGPSLPAADQEVGFRRCLLLVRRVELRAVVPCAHVLPGDQGFRTFFHGRHISWSFPDDVLPQTLEELDEVFSMSTLRQARYGLASPAYWFRKYILRQKVHRVALHHYHPSEEKDRAQVEHRELA